MRNTSVLFVFIFLFFPVFSQTLRIAHKSHSGKTNTYKKMILSGDARFGDVGLGNTYIMDDYNLNKNPDFSKDSFKLSDSKLNDSLITSGDTLKKYLKGMKSRNDINHIIIKDSAKKHAALYNSDKNPIVNTSVNTNVLDVQDKEGKNGLKWLLALLVFVAAPLVLLLSAKKYSQKM